MIVFLALGLRFALENQNAERDRGFGPADADAVVDVTNDGDRNKSFRYLT